jgi:hypothetical protein
VCPSLSLKLASRDALRAGGRLLIHALVVWGWVGVQEIADAGRFVVERLQQAAGSAPHLAPQIQALATAYSMG